MACVVPNCTRSPDAPRSMCWAHYKRDIRYGSPTAGRASYEGDGLAWVENAVKQETDECLPFPFAADGGYGNVIFEGVQMIPSRAVALMAHGPSLGRFSLHGCKTKSCCNKHHVAWGTPAKNMADRRRDGTNLPGSRNPNSKLTEPEVLELRALAGSAPQHVLAAERGISQTTVSSIMRRETWKHI